MPMQPGSPATAERRRHERVQPSGLVYLDIGTENGGIILDLNEAGAGVQAVAPLAALSKISIRFQVPDSSKRVQTEAQIAWVGESRRRVGLHFTGVSDEVRLQIRGWLRSQAAASLAPSPEDNTFASSPLDAAAQDFRQEKWADSATERTSGEEPGRTFAAHELTLNAAAETSFTGNGDAPPAPLSEEIALAKVADSAETTAFDHDTGSSSMASGDHVAGNENAFEHNAHKIERGEVIHWPEIVPAADPVVEPTALKSAAIPVPKPSIPASAVEKLPVSSFLTSRVTARTGGFWKIAIAAVLLLVASFEAGTWLGKGHVLIAPPDPVHGPIQAAVESGADGQRSSTVSREQQLPSLRKHSSVHTRGNLVAPQLSFPASNPPPTPSAVQRNTPPSPPALPNAPVLSIDDARPAQPAPPAPDREPPAQVSSRTVDGRALTATDRFNPAHLIYHFAPDYPAEAKQQNVQGTVKLHLSIDASGDVNQVRLLSGSPLLVPAAISAVRNWRYLPALLNGEPVKSEQDVSVEFRLPAEQ